MMSTKSVANAIVPQSVLTLVEANMRNADHQGFQNGMILSDAIGNESKMELL